MQEQANQIEDLRQNPGAGRHLKTTSPDDLSNALDEWMDKATAELFNRDLTLICRIISLYDDFIVYVLS